MSVSLLPVDLCNPCTDCPDFRLFSSAPPHPISLSPKLRPSRILWEPPCEDTQAEAEIRRSRSQAAAVDFSWIMSESHKPPTMLHSVIHAVAASFPSPEPPFFLIEGQQRDGLSTPTGHRARMALPSPHETSVKGGCCSTVPLNFSERQVARTQKRKKRRRKNGSQRQRQ
ncbi:hypothetical protein FA95DRAFT_1267984 [Auriscalpium vulgare]|uniref:Uncharacterized protein n=1 Tax=Auriscalpium vulgare TaxID=40419 RepID=A0ACB8RUN8_9AGAM|nr:hypothetical protein FA95DRAFT_1267984 [Auriscalpium vulgare]